MATSFVSIAAMNQTNRINSSSITDNLALFLPSAALGESSKLANGAKETSANPVELIHSVTGAVQALTGLGQLLRPAAQPSDSSANLDGLARSTGSPLAALPTTIAPIRSNARPFEKMTPRRISVANLANKPSAFSLKPTSVIPKPIAALRTGSRIG